MENKTRKRKSQSFTANPNIDWSKCDMNKFYDTLSRIMSARYDMDIKITGHKKSDLTDEEIEAIRRHNEEVFARLQTETKPHDEM